MLNGQAAAQSIERLIMPGPVISGHADIENVCKNCHKPFEQTRQRTLCLDCHKDVAADVRAGRGFHGRIRDIRTVECKSCHTEHKGREADIVLLDEDTFDHRMTDFVLRGAHTTVPCASCHKPKQKRRKAPSRCVDCHRGDSPHKGRLGDACTGCHNARAWSEVRFDHTARTPFALTGAHRAVACRACHVNEQYKTTPARCGDCHRANDVHQGRFGAECQSCHSSVAWKTARFDHDRRTRFALTGRHRAVKCETCHTDTLARQKNRTNCVACHRNDDVHRGRNGSDCASCHGTEGWKRTRFAHDRDTRFPLRGRHARLTCESCHKGNVHKQKLQTACIACHKTDDVHKGAQGTQCQRCHNEQGWAQRIRFDHDLTRFPLIGQHAVVPCEECHASQSFKGTASDCLACHRKDDAHKGRLGSACAACHNPNGWALWRFDHDRRTSFALDGKHQGLKCEACHTTPAAKTLRLSRVCGDCHRRDDPHRGAFGRACGTCHTTRSFRELRISR